MIHCQLFTPCTSDTISKSLHCWCENPKWDFSCPVRNKCQQTRNPGGGSSPVPCQVRDGWPSPPLGPVGCVGSPTPHMWLETLLHSGHVAANWNQVAGAATGHSLHPTPHQAAATSGCSSGACTCHVCPQPGGEVGGHVLHQGWTGGLLPQKQQCLLGWGADVERQWTITVSI